MSCRRTVKSFETVEVKITCIDKKSLVEIEETAIAAVTQKLNKLDVLLKNLDVYCENDVLVVNDRFCVCNDLPEIARAFGFEAVQTESGLKGKTYLLRDELTDLIHTLNPQFSLGKYANKQITDELVDLVKKTLPRGEADSELIKMLGEIKERGSYSISGKREVSTTYYDGRVMGKKEGSVTSNKAQVETVQIGRAHV